MQTNLLLNVLMSASGLAGSTPQSPLAGGLLGTPATAGKIGDKFAGLLGQQGVQPQLGLSDTNNPTGDTESSPQELGIALPVLGTYIDHAAPAKIAAANTNAVSLDGSKKAINPQLAAHLNKVIPSGKAVVKDMAAASEVSNEQEFSKLVQNLDNMKLEDGKIKLEGVEDAGKKNDPLMAKIAEQLKNAKTDADANANVKTTNEGDIIAKAGAKSDSEASDLLNNFKTAQTKAGAKTDEKIDGVKFTLPEHNIAAVKHHELQSHIRELKLDNRAQTANTSASEQVQVKIAQAVRDGVDMIRIKLQPEDLGNVDIQLEVENNGNTSIRIIAEKVETLEMLRKDSHSLERALKETGVKADANGLQFSLREGGQQQQFSNNSSGKYKAATVAAVSNDNLPATAREYNLSLGMGTDRINFLA